MTVKQDERVVTGSKVIDEIMALSDKNFWGFEVMYQLRPITEPVFVDGWHCDLLENEKGYIPKTVYPRHKAVKEISFVKQELSLHEVEKREGLLGFSPPEPEPQPQPEPRPQPEPQPQPTAEPQKQVSLADFVLPALSVGAALTVGLVNIILYAVMVDPATVCVVLDEYGRYWWIKTCWWPE